MPVGDFSALETDFDSEVRELVDSISNTLGCVRAVQAAIAIEALGALVLYGIWFLAHVHR